MKKLLSMLCGLAVVLTAAAAPEPDRGKELSSEIEPALKTIEKMLDEIEADFWKNIWEIDRIPDFYESSSPYHSFNGKLVKLVSNCGALQGILYKSGVDVKVRYPIQKPAIALQSIWKNLTQLHHRMWERPNPVLRKVKEALGKDRISSIYLTSEIPEDICNYEALLDDLTIINLELFYIDHLYAWQKIDKGRSPHFRIIQPYPPCARMEIPPGWDSSLAKYCKYFSEDWLISAAGEFFMAVRDLRLFIRGLRRDPFPKPVQNDDPYDLICRIEVDLNQIEREFWDNIYKGGTAAAKSNNLTRYGEFQQRLYRMYDNSRIFLNLLRGRKIAVGAFNPVPDALTIFNIGKHDQDLRHQMRLFFNRANPLEPKSKRDHVQFMYHFRACDADATMLFPLPERMPELNVYFKKVDDDDDDDKDDKTRHRRHSSRRHSSRRTRTKNEEEEESNDQLTKDTLPWDPPFGVVTSDDPYVPGQWKPSPKIAVQRISTSRPYRILPYIPSAELKLLNNPDRIEALCDSNIAIFQSREKRFKLLEKSAQTYFMAVKKLQLSIWHWKEQFAPAKSQDSEGESAESPSSNTDSGSGDESVESSSSNTDSDSGDESAESSSSNTDSDSGDESAESPSSNTDSDSGDESAESPSSNTDSDSGDESAESSSSNTDSDSGDESAESPSNTDSDSGDESAESSSDSGDESAESPSNTDSDSNSDVDEEDASVKLSQLESEELFQDAIDQLLQKKAKAAEIILMKLAKRNYAPAWYLLSRISVDYLQKAAEAGYVPAVEKWLSSNALESAEEQDIALRVAGKIQAIWRLAKKMESMPRNSRQLWLKTIRERAEKGDASCQLLLSYCYQRGNVIKSSSSLAREWLLKAAGQDDPEALSLLSGWHPEKKWDSLDATWADKAIKAGSIPVIAVSTLRRANLPQSVVAHLEAAGKRGDELAMFALICYHSRRKDTQSWLLEQWKNELARYRSLQKLGYCPYFPTRDNRLYQELAGIAKKALRER